METIRSEAKRREAEVMGVLVAGWADAGLHPETFWLGYATIAAAGWNPATEPANAVTAFYQNFYGLQGEQEVERLARVYELMSHQAQFWEDSWDTVPSTSRKGIWGNSSEIYNPRHSAHDQAISLPAAPSVEDLSGAWDWRKGNARRLELAKKSLTQNDELLELLAHSQRDAQLNAYNLEVFESVAKLCRQNLHLLSDLGRMEELLETAQQRAAEKNDANALAGLDAALGLADAMLRDAPGDDEGGDANVVQILAAARGRGEWPKISGRAG